MKEEIFAVLPYQPEYWFPKQEYDEFAFPIL